MYSVCVQNLYKIVTIINYELIKNNIELNNMIIEYNYKSLNCHNFLTQIFATQTRDFLAFYY